MLVYTFLLFVLWSDQDPPLHNISFITEPLFASRILHSKIMWCDVFCASLQGQMISSATWILCRYAPVFPCPVRSAVNSGVIGILVFKLCTRFGKKNRHSVLFAALFHCSCQCSSPFLLILLPTYLNGILSNTVFIFSLFGLLLSRDFRVLHFLISRCAPSPTWSV